MIGEAVDTAVTLGWALAVWVVLLALTAALALHAVVVAVAVPVGAACRAVTAALAASRALRALGEQPERYRPPQRPAWAAA